MVISQETHFAYDHVEGQLKKERLLAKLTNDDGFKFYICDNGSDRDTLSVLFFNGLINRGQVALNSANMLASPTLSTDTLDSFVNDGTFTMADFGSSGGMNAFIHSVKTTSKGAVAYCQTGSCSKGASNLGDMRTSQLMIEPSVHHQLISLWKHELLGLAVLVLEKALCLTNHHLDRYYLSTDETAYLATQCSRILLGTGEQQNDLNVAGSCNENVICFANVVPDFSLDRYIPSANTGGRTFCFNIQ